MKLVLNQGMKPAENTPAYLGLYMTAGPDKI